ncbi:MAG TPA: type III pantothenate kinase [Pyrinomonadaceae bacterium]
MLLVIDVGNSNTSLGVYHGEELIAHWRLTTNVARTVDEYGVHARNLFELANLDFKAIDAIALTSVVPPLNYTLKKMAEDYFHLSPLFIDHTTNTGLTILYEPPSDVGADRIVDAVAAVKKYGAPCIVVDFGTATTFNAINSLGQYLGGVITPGIVISSEALFVRTAKLPRVDIKRPAKVIGSSTTAAMRSGLYYGYAGLVDGVLQRMITELGSEYQPPRVIATGGLARLIATASEIIELVDETLTLEGIRLVYERTRAGER